MAANLHVRNVPDDIVRQIKVRAASNGRSAEAEHRAALEKVVGGDRTGWLQQVEALEQSILDRRGGRPLPASVDLIREDRDSR